MGAGQNLLAAIGALVLRKLCRNSKGMYRSSGSGHQLNYCQHADGKD